MIKEFCFLPFVGYFVAIIANSSYFMILNPSEDLHIIWKIVRMIAWLLSVSGTVYFGYIEVRQMI